MDQALLADSGSQDLTQTVLRLAPHLSAEGTQRALHILERAIANAKEAQALNSVVLQAQGAGYSGMPCFAAAAGCMHLRVSQQQAQLHQELRSLYFFEGQSLASAAPTPMPGEILCNELLPGPRPATPVSVDYSTAGLMGAHLVGAGTLGVGVCGARGVQPSTLRAARQPAFVEPIMMPVSGKVPDKAAASIPFKGTNVAKMRQSTASNRGQAAQTLSASLQQLANEDPDCLFIVRRINKLGFKASRTLKQYFSAHGPVVRVLLAHSTVRQHGDPQCHARRRPSSLGFVQMAAAAAVQTILALGSEQEVDGALIRVQKFERQGFDDEDQVDEGECLDEYGELPSELAKDNSVKGSSGRHWSMSDCSDVSNVTTSTVTSESEVFRAANSKASPSLRLEEPFRGCAASLL